MDCMKNEAFGKKKMTSHAIFVEGEYWKFVLKNTKIDYTLEHIYYQHNTKIVAPLIVKYYSKRLEYQRMMASHPKGSAEYVKYDKIQKGLKILLNSMYGKMCEKGYHANVVFYDSRYETFENENKVYPCILTGSFITYRARLKLLNAIKKVVDAGYDFLYADTDSITLGCPKNSDLTPIFGSNSTSLGEWKDEGTYDLYLCIFKKKKYFMANRETKKVKMALSGVPKRIHDILEKQWGKNFKRVVDDMERFFDPNENFTLVSCKPAPFENFIGQQIIVNVDFSLNSELLEPTGFVRFTEDDYHIERPCH